MTTVHAVTATQKTVDGPSGKVTLSLFNPKSEGAENGNITCISDDANF